MSKRRRVALSMDLRGSYDIGVARGVIRYAKENGNWRLFGHGWTLDELEDLEHWEGDGIIARVRGAEDADALTGLGVPVVDVCQTLKHSKLNFVTNDDFETGRVAGEHLRTCGFKQFAFCGVNAGEWSSERFRGFLKAVGADEKSVPVYKNPLSWWEHSANMPQLKRWLRSLKTPVGLMACNDTVGVKITAACQQLGINIPNEIAAIGVDNEDVLCELANPTLTSVPCDCERMGYEAAKLLDRAMSGRGKYVETSIRVAPLPIVARASTDVLAIQDELVAQAMRFIRGNTDLSMNVSDVLRAVPSSRRNLETRFRKTVGHTIHDEIRRARLEHACHLLRTTDLPFAKVALNSGFNSHQRFHAVFCEHLKMLPSHYRESKRR